MRTFQQALSAAFERLGAIGNGLALIETATEERDEGWVFYHQGEDYLATGDFSSMLVGNAPLFVPRDGATPAIISYHRSVDESMAAYRFCGDPNAAPNAEVVLSGWKIGASKVSATQTIRSATSLGLSEAKQTVDACLNGHAVPIGTASVDGARALVSTLASLGFIAEISYGERQVFCMPDIGSPLATGA
ncbi:YrhB domain-containing protein [Paucibacter sp. M5-1]|uniref:YrhB domain-containing protein n=1 Tax=Paucibacter sp. M5-1 TaxID=3015998 RepID=UPI0022B8E65C|nr:YrhB domain-containing protein [Paucibacter sp. M5-1]MCZ7883207.1 YrhB domain-containing protein [Paucibacter sp. M5-1]